MNTTKIRLRLDWPPRTLHPNDRPNRWAKAQAIRNYRYSAWFEAKQARGPEGLKFTTPVTATVTFHVKDNIARDEDGLLSSIKAGIDGVVDSGIISGDSHQKLHIVSGGVVVGDERCVYIDLEGAL